LPAEEGTIIITRKHKIKKKKTNDYEKTFTLLAFCYYMAVDFNQLAIGSAADKAQYFRGKITTKGFTYYHT
jgi:hypothetical protein